MLLQHHRRLPPPTAPGQRARTPAWAAPRPPRPALKLAPRGAMEELGIRNVRLWAAGFGGLALAATLHPPLWSALATAAVAALGVGTMLYGVLALARGPGPSEADIVGGAIRARRSVFPKDFLPAGKAEPVTREHLEQLLDAARWAPSHKMTEPWHFVVLSGATKAAFEELTIKLCRDKLPPERAEATVAKLKRKQAKDWPKVQHYVAICMKRHEELPEWEEVAAVACAVQNMSLVASSMGVGGYWSSWQPVARDAPEMGPLLAIDPSCGDRCLGVFAVGRPDPARVANYRPRRTALSEKVVWLQ